MLCSFDISTEGSAPIWCFHFISYIQFVRCYVYSEQKNYSYSNQSYVHD